MIKNQEKGQALITLIFFTVIAVVIITAAVSVLFTNNLSTTNSELGLEAYYAAESGAEDGLLHLIRDPVRDPTHTETYQPLGTTEELVTITGNTKIESTGTINNTVRKIQVQTVYTNGKIIISSWKEI